MGDLMRCTINTLLEKLKKLDNINKLDEDDFKIIAEKIKKINE